MRLEGGRHGTSAARPLKSDEHHPAASSLTVLIRSRQVPDGFVRHLQSETKATTLIFTVWFMKCIQGCKHVGGRE